MQAYLGILEEIYYHGTDKPNRTDVDTKSIFATRFRHDLRNGFPLLTTKKINPVLPLAEMFAFFKGVTHLDGFHELDCKIWDQWGLKQDFGKWSRKTHEELSSDLVEYEATQGNEITIEQASIMLQECENTHHNYHADLRHITEQNANHEFAVAQGNITKWMMENPEPIGLMGFLNKRKINSFKYEVVYPKGYLGPIYGAQWLGWKTPDGRVINQISQVVDELRSNPNSRRIVLLGWNPSDISDGRANLDENNNPIVTSDDRVQANIMEGKMALPPCHLMTIFNVSRNVDGEKVLNLHQIMRSSDVPIGLPFNIAGYAYFLALLAHQLGYIAGELVIDSTDAHIYENQMEFVPTQLKRIPKKLPTFNIPKDFRFNIMDKDSLTIDLVKEIVGFIDGYEPAEFIPYPVTT